MQKDARLWMGCVLWQLVAVLLVGCWIFLLCLAHTKLTLIFSNPSEARRRVDFVLLFTTLLIIFFFPSQYMCRLKRSLRRSKRATCCAIRKAQTCRLRPPSTTTTAAILVLMVSVRWSRNRCHARKHCWGKWRNAPRSWKLPYMCAGWMLLATCSKRY